MGKFIAQDWDFERPLWEMVLVSNYHDEDGAECAIITRGLFHPFAAVLSLTHLCLVIIHLQTDKVNKAIVRQGHLDQIEFIGCMSLLKVL